VAEVLAAGVTLVADYGVDAVAVGGERARGRARERAFARFPLHSRRHGQRKRRSGSSFASTLNLPVVAKCV